MARQKVLSSLGRDQNSEPWVRRGRVGAFRVARKTTRRKGPSKRGSGFSGDEGTSQAGSCRLVCRIEFLVLQPPIEGLRSNAGNAGGFLHIPLSQ
jgi:hypothetical protein